MDLDLKAVLEEATGIPAQEAGGVVTVKFSNRVVAVQRASLWADGGRLHLGMWPAELTPQFKRVYSDPKKVEALIELDGHPGWSLRSNLHLSFFRAAPRNRWYARRVPVRDYMQQWMNDLGRAGRFSREDIENPQFLRWLLEGGYANETDLPIFKEWLTGHQIAKFDIRPSIEVLRTWDVAESVAPDRSAGLVTAVRDAINQVLLALDEPTVPSPQSTSASV